MSPRHPHEFDDARLDEALRAAVGADEPTVDLRPRVMGAIERARVDRAARAPVGWRAGARSAWPRLAFAAGMVAIVALASAVWLTTRPAAPPVVGDGSTVPVTPTAMAPLDTAVSGIERQPRPIDSDATQPPRRSAARQESPHPQPSIPVLPALGRPDPLEIDRLEQPPLVVARLEIDRLSFEPLAVEPLDALEKE